MLRSSVCATIDGAAQGNLRPTGAGAGVLCKQHGPALSRAYGNFDRVVANVNASTTTTAADFEYRSDLAAKRVTACLDSEWASSVVDDPCEFATSIALAQGKLMKEWCSLDLRLLDDAAELEPRAPAARAGHVLELAAERERVVRGGGQQELRDRNLHENHVARLRPGDGLRLGLAHVGEGRMTRRSEVLSLVASRLAPIQSFAMTALRRLMMVWPRRSVRWFSGARGACASMAWTFS